MSKRKVLAAAGVSAAASLVGIALLATSATGSPSPGYARNAHGQTYGSAADATDLETRPDLIRAFTSDGREGYVNKTDLQDQLAKNPTEALAAQKARTGPRQIPVFTEDGVTQIGTFTIGVPQIGTSPAPKA